MKYQVAIPANIAVKKVAKNNEFLNELYKFLPFPKITNNIPIIDYIIPNPATINGSKTAFSIDAKPPAIAAKAIVAIIEST